MAVDALSLFKCLADASRLKILSGLASGPMYGELIAQRLALSPSTVSFHLKKLEAAGLVTQHKEQYYHVYALVPGLWDQPLSSFLPLDTQSPEAQREAAYRQKVLDAFFHYGKLTCIPAQQKKRLIILERIAAAFEMGMRYPEKEVNLIISAFHDDFCTLRRELVGHGFMEREQGVYWRVMKGE